MCYRDGLDYDDNGYLELCQSHNLQTLEMRRNVTDLCNLNKDQTEMQNLGITQCNDINTDSLFLSGRD